MKAYTHDGTEKMFSALVLCCLSARSMSINCPGVSVVVSDFTNFPVESPRPVCIYQNGRKLPSEDAR